MTDNIFGELRTFDQGIELDAGLDAELVAHKDDSVQTLPAAP